MVLENSHTVNTLDKRNLSADSQHFCSPFKISPYLIMLLLFCFCFLLVSQLRFDKRKTNQPTDNVSHTDVSISNCPYGPEILSFEICLQIFYYCPFISSNLYLAILLFTLIWPYIFHTFII